MGSTGGGVESYGSFMVIDVDEDVDGAPAAPPGDMLSRLLVIGEQVGGLLADEPWRLSDGALAQLIEGVHQVGSRLTAVRGQALADAFSRGFAVRQGAADLPGWLRERLVLAPTEARRQVAVARDLDGPCQLTGQALAAGEIGADQARVICEAMRVLPGGISTQQRAAAERVLVEYAHTFDPYQLVKLAARLREQLTMVDTSPGGEDPAADAGSGGRGKGHDSDKRDANGPGDGSASPGADADSAVNDAAVNDTAGSDAAAGGEDARRAGSDGRAGEGSRQDEAGSPDPAAVRRLSFTDTPQGTTLIYGELDAEGAALLRSALDGLAAPQPAENGTPDRRGSARRRADALIELVSRAVGAGAVPASGGIRPQLVVTVPWATLVERGVEVAETSWGLPLPRGALRRLSCDAEVVRILVDPHGVPLDVGRTTRTIPPALRRALAVRDRGCVFPGCDRPPSWCEGHHVIHWLFSGVTALHNLVLLCGDHHRRVHHDGWDITFDEHQRPQLIPPYRVDPHRRPRHNPYSQPFPDRLLPTR
ncbi:HNH endonuclease signature motif containing protein [Frankia sp. AgKG'84/4]|uniref:HNH endonuclease signature motif containing protein n=1 Tax=Frankia sp. AgKG'84/4 TaxID=573490 RepID=UPI0020108CE3|nr:HNH endonuclease signature motif containing protein [Frankia sp. AgKG'84/4]MCL9793780.1 HNH endonuclease [Frankia sp. AgKG'84/4]